MAGFFENIAGYGLGAASKMNPVTAGISAIPELFKLGAGIKQGIEAAKIRRNTVRPTMEVPKSAQEAIAFMRAGAGNTKMPGQDAIAGQIAGQTAGGMRSARESGGGTAERLAAYAAMARGGQQQMTNLGIQGAQNQAINKNTLNQALLGPMARFQQEAWDYNTNQPYQQAMAQASQLGTDSRANVYSGLKGIGISAASMLGPGNKQTAAIQQPVNPTTDPVAPVAQMPVNLETPGFNPRGLPDINAPMNQINPGQPMNPGLLPTSNRMQEINAPIMDPNAPNTQQTDASAARTNAIWNMIRNFRKPQMKSPVLSPEDQLNQMSIPYNIR